MKSGKHILILTPGFPADESDDSCIPLLQDYLLTFSELHPEIRFSVVSFEYPFVTSAYNWKGIKVFPCNGRNKKLPLKMWTWEKASKVIVEINKNDKIDLLHALWLDQCALIGNRISKKTGIPLITSMMGQDAKSTNKYLRLLPLEKLIVIAQSEVQAKLFEKNTGRKPSDTIAAGISQDLIKIDKDVDRQIDILGVGSLTPLKNYGLFLRVIQLVKEYYPAVQAEIIGEGNEKEALLQIVKSLKISENVRFTGKLPRKEVLEKMQHAKIFLHCSNYESVGMVFLEAQLAACKIVSKPIGIAQESSFWKTSYHEKEMASYAVEFLKENSQADWTNKIRPMKDMVQDYLKLYLEESK